jgi:hypothetical protein
VADVSKSGWHWRGFVGFLFGAFAGWNDTEFSVVVYNSYSEPFNGPMSVCLLIRRDQRG